MNEVANAPPRLLRLAGIAILFLVPAVVAARTGRLDVLDALTDTALAVALVLALYYASVGLLSKYGAPVLTTTRYPCGATQTTQGYAAHGFAYYPAGNPTSCPQHPKRCKTRPALNQGPSPQPPHPRVQSSQVPRGGGDE